MSSIRIHVKELVDGGKTLQDIMSAVLLKEFEMVSTK